MSARARTYHRGLFVAPLCIALALACRTALPNMDTAAAATQPVTESIVTGKVLAGVNTIRVGGRRVSAVNLQTGDRVTAITGGSGDFTLVLSPGRYRLDIDHSSTETVTRAKNELTVGVSTLQDGFDIRIVNRAAPASPRIYQPPLPTGAPIV